MPPWFCRWKQPVTLHRCEPRGNRYLREEVRRLKDSDDGFSTNGGWSPDLSSAFTIIVFTESIKSNLRAKSSADFIVHDMRGRRAYRTFLLPDDEPSSTCFTKSERNWRALLLPQQLRDSIASSILALVVSALCSGFPTPLLVCQPSEQLESWNFFSRMWRLRN